MSTTGEQTNGKKVDDVPFVSTAQMIEVDRAMIEDFKIELVQMMENAGRNLAHLARRRFLGGEPVGKVVAVLAGTGANGGGGLVAARHLHNWGAHVQVFTTKPAEQFTPVPAHQLEILRRMQIPVEHAEAVTQFSEADLIVDALIGYSLKGAPTGMAADLIRWANALDAPVLALDIPTGIDASTGAVFDPAIRAAATMTLALPKTGLRAPSAQDRVGELYLADIGAPRELFAAPTLRLSVGVLFAHEEVIRLL